MLDADGVYAHFIFPGDLPDQPDYDMKVYDVIRLQWVELRNEELKRNGQERNRTNRK